MVAFVKDIVMAVSSLVVAAVAVLGLYTWRRELAGKAKFELARRLGVLAIRLKTGFQWARLGATFAGECDGRERGEKESPMEANLLDEWYARRRRVERLHSDLAEFEQAGWEAEVLLDENKSKEVAEVVKDFKEAWAALSTAVNFYFERELKRVTESKERDDELLRELHRTVYGGQWEHSERLEMAVERLKQALRGYVR